MRLSASNLWRAAACPASAVLPWEKKTYADAQRGVREHAALEASTPPGSYAEVAYAYNVLSGSAREVGRSIGREYGELAEGEIPGTADLVCAQDDHVLITDWKTGHGYKVEHPKTNLQLHHNGLCAALVLKRPRVIAQVVFTRTGEVWDGEYDLFDFASIAMKLRAIWEACRAPEPAVVPDVNHQCWRCPAKKACPIMGKQRKAS